MIRKFLFKKKIFFYFWNTKVFFMENKTSYNKLCIWTEKWDGVMDYKP